MKFLKTIILLFLTIPSFAQSGLIGDVIKISHITETDTVSLTISEGTAHVYGLFDLDFVDRKTFDEIWELTETERMLHARWQYRELQKQRTDIWVYVVDSQGVEVPMKISKAQAEYYGLAKNNVILDPRLVNRLIDGSIR